MNLSDEASAATVALITGVEMQRFHVHVSTRQINDQRLDWTLDPRLVLFAESIPGEGAVNWWVAGDDGQLVAHDASQVRVCAGRECPVEGCTRAESLRTAEAGYGATPASEALDLLPTPLTEGENQAITQYHRDIETEISNLAYFLEREFPEPLTASGAAAVLGVCRGLLLELKSRRAEQGLLRDHPTDPPMNRIRFWMDRNYPDERNEEKVFSDWVIAKLEDGKGIREYREGQMAAIVETIAALWPEKVPAGGWMGNAASTTIALLEELHGLYRKAQSASADRFVHKATGKALDPTLMELDLDERGQVGTKHFVCKHHSGFANETPECRVCHGEAEPVWYRYHGSGAPQFMTRDEVEHTTMLVPVELTGAEERQAYAHAQRAIIQTYQYHEFVGPEGADLRTACVVCGAYPLDKVHLQPDVPELTGTDAAWVERQQEVDAPATYGPSDSLDSQIDRLANFIMAEIPGEPSQNEGAVDTAIRVMRDLQEQVRLRKEVQQKQLGPILVAVDHLFGEDAKAVLTGKGWTDIETAIPLTLERVAERLKRYEQEEAAVRAVTSDRADEVVQLARLQMFMVDNFGMSPKESALVDRVLDALKRCQKQDGLIEQTLTLLASGDDEERKLARELRTARSKGIV